MSKAKSNAPTIVLDEKQVIKACKALKVYLDGDGKDESLLAEERGIYMNVTLKLQPTKDRRAKMARLKHSLYNTDDADVCFLCKDPQEEYESMAQQAQLKNLAIRSVSWAKAHLKTHEARRKFLKQFDLILADDRIHPMTSNMLGTKAYEYGRLPVGVKIKKRNFKRAIEMALDRTYFYVSGTSVSIRIGNSAMSWKQLAENFILSFPAVLGQLPKMAQNVSAVYLTGDNLPSLPVWLVDVDHLVANAVKQEMKAKRKAKAKASDDADDKADNSAEAAPAKKSKPMKQSTNAKTTTAPTSATTAPTTPATTATKAKSNKATPAKPKASTSKSAPATAAKSANARPIKAKTSTATDKVKATLPKTPKAKSDGSGSASVKKSKAKPANDAADTTTTPAKKAKKTSSNAAATPKASKSASAAQTPANSKPGSKAVTPKPAEDEFSPLATRSARKKRQAKSRMSNSQNATPKDKATTSKAASAAKRKSARKVKA
eukprot:TRINITY_DN7482_c0_g3_i1.p1 TRINITY_DN7482_c0_g3~~TRINITY_DN7482_c0_g3_i1.p1  ORF type:complete len:490 (+),score=146.10 TRINITY_DN7482_c0_g3_i1:3-1472(+)